MPHAQVLNLPPGSLLVLTDVLPAGDPPEVLDGMLGAIFDAVGHRDFGILRLESGAAVDVYGPDEIVDRVRALLAEQASR